MKSYLNSYIPGKKSGLPGSIESRFNNEGDYLKRKVIFIEPWKYMHFKVNLHFFFRLSH